MLNLTSTRSPIAQLLQAFNLQEPHNGYSTDLSWSFAMMAMAFIPVIVYGWNYMNSDGVPYVFGGLFHRLFASMYPLNMEHTFQKGIKQCPNSAFRTRVFPFGDVLVLTNRRLMDEILHAPVEQLSFDEVSITLIQPYYTGFGYAPGAHPVKVISQNFNRRFGSLVPGILQDIKRVVTNAFPDSNEDWKCFTVYHFAEMVTSTAALHAIVGSELSKNKEVAKIAYAFATKAVKAAKWINVFPSYMHFIVGPLISSANKERRKMMKVIAPVVDERREMLAKFGNEWTDRPDDYLMCLIESADNDFEASYTGLATRVLQFAFASFHTSGNAVSHLLLDLAASSSLITDLREEIKEMTAYDDSTISYDSLMKMTLMDGFLAESARLSSIGISVERSSSFGLASVSRYARVPYTFTSSSSTSRPLHIRKGSVVMGRTDVLHRDPNVYPNPDELDPQRYQGAQSGGEKKVAHKSPHTALTQHYMYFGFGKHPCPGRFFANIEFKAILCYILMEYDLKTIDGVRPPNDELGMGVLPSRSAKLLVRKRRGGVN